MRTLGGDVYCWGYNAYGQLGQGNTEFANLVPSRVVGLPSVAKVVSTKWHVCAISGTRELYCWGYNNNGQIGDGTHTDRPTPVPVSLGAPAGPIGDALDVALGFESTCAVRFDGAVLCWGDNDHGQLGDGTHTTRDTPALVNYEEQAGVVQPFMQGLGVFGTSNSGACALSQQTVFCWGANDLGELGLGPDRRTLTDYPIATKTILPTGTRIASFGEDMGCVYLAPSTGLPTIQCFGQAALVGQGIVPGSGHDDALPVVLTPKPVAWPDPLE
jgi:hypothetical protein